MSSQTKPLTTELSKLKDEICQYALDYGLDFYPVVFEICDYDTINILAAQEGFPHRYPHWKFGMQYDQLSKSHAYGLSKIYEMVVNTNPCYAYLLKANNWVDQKIVMSHVYGHADFFKNNAWFKNTDRSMIDGMANHRTKIRRYMERFGQDCVETFIDHVLSLENLLDVNVLFETPTVRDSRTRKEKQYKKEFLKNDEHDERAEHLKSFMRSKLVNPEDRPNRPDIEDEPSVDRPAKPVATPRDIMMYLIENAPLREWELDILGCLREEAYYFLPQRMTKIMNEGWASYWHSTIMTNKAARASEIVDFGDKHAGVVATDHKKINPYKLGIELFRDIEYRWNTGRFGKKYRECRDMTARENWNEKTDQGRKKIFDIRRTHNDITFIDEFFTEDFCLRHKFFAYKFNSRSGRFEINSREFETVKKKLLMSLANFGSPIIEVESGNYKNRSELHLVHNHQGLDLDLKYTMMTLKSVHSLWKRPVNITTKNNGEEMVVCFDGEKFN